MSLWGEGKRGKKRKSAPLSNEAFFLPSFHSLTPFIFPIIFPISAFFAPKWKEGAKREWEIWGNEGGLFGLLFVLGPNNKESEERENEGKIGCYPPFICLEAGVGLRLTNHDFGFTARSQHPSLQIKGDSSLSLILSFFQGLYYYPHFISWEK